MTPLDAHHAARALADLGHTGAEPIPGPDIDMAAVLAGVPAPRSARDRIQICAALDDLRSRATDGRHSA